MQPVSHHTRFREQRSFMSTSVEQLTVERVQPNVQHLIEADHSIQSVAPPTILTTPLRHAVPPPLPPMPHANASGSLAGLFDLDIRVGFLATVADLVLFGGDVCTLGGLTPIIFCFSIVLGVMVIV
jgi:hypothetical protein